MAPNSLLEFFSSFSSFDQLPNIMRPENIGKLSVPDKFKEGLKVFLTDVLREYEDNVLAILLYSRNFKNENSSSSHSIGVVFNDLGVTTPRDEIHQRVEKILRTQIEKLEGANLDVWLLTEIWRAIREQQPSIDRFFATDKVLYDRSFYFPLRNLYLNNEIAGTSKNINKFIGDLAKMRESTEQAKTEVLSIPHEYNPFVQISEIRKVLPDDRTNVVETLLLRLLNDLKSQLVAIIIWGSILSPTRRPGADTDIAVIVEERAVEATPPRRFDVMRQSVYHHGKESGPDLHIQCYTPQLVWTWLIRGEPVIRNIISSGIAAYDRGCFHSLKGLQESLLGGNRLVAIDALRKTSEDEFLAVDNQLLQDALHKLELSVVSISQVLLMELGYSPPPPRSIPLEIMEKLVIKRHDLMEDDIQGLQALIGAYKRVNSSGKERPTFSDLAQHYAFANTYRQKILGLLNERKEHPRQEMLYMFVESME